MIPIQHPHQARGNQGDIVQPYIMKENRKMTFHKEEKHTSQNKPTDRDEAQPIQRISIV